jgi:hemolysin activation/secretion protein
MTASSNVRCRYVQPKKSRLCGLLENTALVITLFVLGYPAVAAEPPAAVAPPAAVTLSSVVVRGSTVYDAAARYSAYRAQLGKPIDAASVRELTAALSDRYAADGYARPQLRIEPALVGAGVLRVEVLETRIDVVNVGGNPGPHRERLERLGAALRARVPVGQNDMQDALKRMRELPGLTLEAKTARDERNPNVYRLDLDAGFAPVSGSVRLSNRGTDEIGPNFLIGQLAVNGIFGGPGSAGTFFSTAVGDFDEYRGVGGFAATTLGDGGPRLAATGFRSRSDPQERLVDRDHLYLRDRATLRVTLPPLNGGAWSPFFGMRLDDLEIERNGVRLRDERLRIAEGGVVLGARRPDDVQTAANFEIAKGLNAFGSGLYAGDLSVDRRSAYFVLTRVTFARLRPLGAMWSLRFDAFAQHSAYVLPYAERFKIGGDRLGRGFEVAEIAGDGGAGAKIEGRRRLPQAPALFGQASVYGFYDIGAAFKQDTPGRESAATAGFGVSARTPRAVSTLELAQPLTHADVEGKKDLSLFFEVAVTF